MSTESNESDELSDLERWQIEEIKKGLEALIGASLPAMRKSSKR